MGPFSNRALSTTFNGEDFNRTNMSLDFVRPNASTPTSFIQLRTPTAHTPEQCKIAVPFAIDGPREVYPNRVSLNVVEYNSACLDENSIQRNEMMLNNLNPLHHQLNIESQRSCLISPNSQDASSTVPRSYTDAVLETEGSMLSSSPTQPARSCNSPCIRQSSSPSPLSSRHDLVEVCSMSDGPKSPRSDRNSPRHCLCVSDHITDPILMSVPNELHSPQHQFRDGENHPNTPMTLQQRSDLISMIQTPEHRPVVQGVMQMLQIQSGFEICQQHFDAKEHKSLLERQLTVKMQSNCEETGEQITSCSSLRGSMLGIVPSM
jgi:hypothetical protein